MHFNGILLKLSLFSKGLLNPNNLKYVLMEKRKATSGIQRWDPDVKLWDMIPDASGCSLATVVVVLMFIELPFHMWHS